MADIKSNDDRILALKDELQTTRARLDEAERLLGRIVDDVRDAIHEDDMDEALAARLERADQLLGPRDEDDDNRGA